MSFSSTHHFILLALVWRIFIASATSTFFQPDEYYQSLEVAHHAIFGYGHLTWEWTSTPPIRSISFPALYMPIFWLLRTAKLDNTLAIVSLSIASTTSVLNIFKILAPKVFQGALVSLTDIATRELARRILGERHGNVAVGLNHSST